MSRHLLWSICSPLFTHYKVPSKHITQCTYTLHMRVSCQVLRERRRMGANEKRSLSVSAMSIFLVILLQLVFNTNHIGATTALSTQFNFNSNNSSSTYHCNGSVDECLIMDGVESGLTFMDSVHTTRILENVNTNSIAENAALFPDQSALADCGRGKPYKGCEPKPNSPKPKTHCGVYVPNRECPPS